MQALRQYRRLPVTLSLSVNLRCEDDPATIPATVRDVSLGGLGIECMQKLPVGMIVELQHRDFPCARTSSTTSKCRVVSVCPANIRAYGFWIGLSFDPIDEEFVQNLLQWVKKQAIMQMKARQQNPPTRPPW
jgi:hypothetical protein